MMYYLTYYKKTQTNPQISLLDILNGITNETVLSKVTIPLECTEEEALQRIPPTLQMPQIPENLDMSYNTFFIPKKSGGFRTINAPNDELMELLRTLKYTLEHTGIQTHDAAHAYVKNRSILTALKTHQKNNSKHFLKIDFSDFFGSFTKQHILEQLKQVYPFAIYALRPEWQQIEQIVTLALKDNVLPQGTPLSPLLTNICMVPIDFKINAFCKKANLIYTRYADDIIISSKTQFKYRNIVNVIKKIIPEWLTINPTKTRYGSNGGKNWNLGLMLNKENKITIGHKKKEILKATIYNALTEPLNTQQKQEIQGYISYVRLIEPAYVDNIIRRLEQKTGKILKNQLK